MPLKVADLAKDVRSLPEIVIGEGTLNVKYRRPSPKYLDEVADGIRARGENPESRRVTDAVAAQIVPLLAEWDFLEENGEPKPLNAESLSLLPWEVVQYILGAIVERETPSPNG